jgi:hypothetical protein
LLSPLIGESYEEAGIPKTVITGVGMKLTAFRAGAEGPLESHITSGVSLQQF